MRRKKKPVQKYKAVELFESINDMWLYNWERLNTAPFDPKWMIKNDRDRLRNPNIRKERLQANYFLLHDQYSERTGSSEKIEEWQSLVIMRMEARLLYAKGDLKQINFINHYSNMIDELTKQGEEINDMVKTRMLYGKAFGEKINPKETTVEEFIIITEEVQAQNRTKNGN